MPYIVCPCCGEMIHVEVSDLLASLYMETPNATAEEVAEYGYDLADRKEVRECRKEKL